MTKLSIVIPYVGGIEAFELGLASVLTHRPPDAEVVVALARPYDDPYQLADEVRFVDGSDVGSWSDAANLGVSRAQAEVVHVLDAGVIVADGWADAALARFDDPAVATVSPVVCDAEDPSRSLAAGVAYYRCGEPWLIRTEDLVSNDGHAKLLCPTAAGGFYRKSALEHAGGFHAGVSREFAEIDLGLRLRHCGWLAVAESGSKIFSSTLPESSATTLHRAMAAERLFWRNAPVVGWRTSLIRHALRVLGSLRHAPSLRSAVWQVTGGFLGVAAVPTLRGHYRFLREIHGAGGITNGMGKPRHRHDPAHASGPPPQMRTVAPRGGAAASRGQ